jgi:potassium-transporting ATPase potassium-binding subunit
VLVKPVERGVYRLTGIDAQQEMNWQQYLCSLLLINFLSFLFLYLIARLQFFLPFNPQQVTGLSPLLAFNTAVSFVTNTDWQAYNGEMSLSYLTQMMLTVQNFFSAATGMAVLVALMRGLTRREAKGIGNFWKDFTRSILYILLPLSCVLALLLISQGVIQNFKPNQLSIFQQVLPMGPVASQVAIQQLGTNGGGFFGANAAFPYENPTPLANFLEMLAILLIPAALCYTFGVMVKAKREGFAILLAMLLIFIPFTLGGVAFEQIGNPTFTQLGVDPTPRTASYPAGNMEGKETRFGIVSSALFAAATTASSNGSVNARLDAFTPLGGFVPLWLMQLGEVVFGGVGSGLYRMLLMIFMTVFIAGLMVGRTPEYLGKKIEVYEIKMASFAILVMPAVVLLFASMSAILPSAFSVVGDPFAHGFSEILYAATSIGANNGSAFAGLHANNAFYNFFGGFVMAIGRYLVIAPVLAIAGSLASKKTISISSGTLPTDTPWFVLLLIFVIVIFGALTFFPALALGPIVEQLLL